VRRAALSYLPNGELLDGAKVMLFNNFVNGTIGKNCVSKLQKNLMANTNFSATNIWDRINPINDSFGVACSLNTSPLTRNTWKIEKIHEKNTIKDKIIRYGDKFRIIANERVFPQRKKVGVFLGMYLQLRCI
jgi:hypothetical protein